MREYNASPMASGCMVCRPFLSVLLAGALAFMAATGRAETPLVFAAVSTTDALGAVIAAYEKTPGARVRASFAASSALARQIASGAPANLFLSANEKWMDWLARRGRIDPASRRDLLRNALVLIAPQKSRIALKLSPGTTLAAALGKGRLALGDPDHVPAGIYAKEALTRLGVWNAVAGRTARMPDVRAALALVERGEAPLGVVYATDARMSDRVRVVDRFPQGTHPSIIYPFALVAGRATAEARRFHAFLAGPEARGIFTRFGFMVD